ncbi:MAG: response regulator transcription factor [Ruminococcus sp.]|jgi:DNA-binding LytR/AlgR family response regulator|uniref:Stage 0 sporulation protein A homolog n=1 Tax=Schaedlerella arabinosiphila TaxID=2044587 RepID=A0A426DC99_9FIRM|nr:LytTR family DNA-binding domain-containing protein [Schaedlerella arabinosiphila]MCI8722997.1 response regulator transcription factor [Ruminococcus sp.]MCI9212407.1 response regulator transcription factor [Ruminococcus sp.]RRK30295.1 DNA-binding response regulator [Schaedlerella arabinosiphila]
MLHIAICDDEQSFVDHLKSLIRQYAAETGEEIKVSPYYDGLDLIEKYDPTVDLIFLDIQMKLVDGLRTAEKIRQMDEKVGIIFLTTLTQYGLEGYKYRAADYIIKPIRYVRLRDELNRFLSMSRQDASPSLIIKNDSGKYKIFLKSLRYIETFNRNLLFHTEQEKIICYKSMKEVEQELKGQGFARSHSSYLVNLFYIKGVQKLEITLVTGEILPISQPKRKQFMEELTEYWGDMI